MTAAITPDACEFYTPEWILDIVYNCFPVTIDPCTPVGYPNVSAEIHYTKEYDGLSHQWYGNVYMNCPYGRGIADWVNHLLVEYRAGRVKNAIALLPVKSDTRWFNDLVGECPSWCSFRGRVKFEHGYDRKICSTGTFPSGLFLLTWSPCIQDKFYQKCKYYGYVWKDWMDD